MGTPKNLTPGTPAPHSGVYQLIGPRSGEGPERTAVKGEPLPPAPTKGSTYKLVRPAHNGAGRGK